MCSIAGIINLKKKPIYIELLSRMIKLAKRDEDIESRAHFNSSSAEESFTIKFFAVLKENLEEKIF